MNKEIRLEIKPRNNIVLTKMEEQGIKSIAELCRRAGIRGTSYNKISSIVNFKESPLKNAGGEVKGLKMWKEGIQKVAEVLDSTPEHLFPDSLKGIRLSREERFLEVSLTDFRRLTGASEPLALNAASDPETLLLEGEFDSIIQNVLKTLSPREEKIIKHVFGLVDGQTPTLDEVGHFYGVTGNRIDQILNKALRKLRHPSRSRQLRDMAEAKGVLPKRS